MRQRYSASLLMIMAMIYHAHSCTVTSWTTYYDCYATLCGKSYTTSQNTTRQGYYNTHAAQISTINGGSNSYTAGFSCFSDWSDNELRSLTQGVKSISSPVSDSFSQFSSLPTTNVDWNNQSAVTSVKDQGSCSAAWAFAIAAMSESSMILKEAQTLDISEQFLVQCTRLSSCDGGYLEYALETIVYEGGIPLESQYRYDVTTTPSGICSGGQTKSYISSSLYHFYGLSDTEVIQLLSRGPVAVSVSSQDWEYYESGIFACAANAPIDHAVLLVAVTDSYWVAKNSWGTNWGINGYIHITRNNANDCGIGNSVHMLSEGVLILGMWVLAVLIFI